MSTFERYLTLWVALCILAGIALGHLMPSAFQTTGAAEIATAEEKIAAAMSQLEKIDTIKTAANAIQKNATKIDGESTSIRTSIQRSLDEALTALAGAGSAPQPGGTGGIEAGAA